MSDGVQISNITSQYGPLIAKDIISGKVEQTVGQNYRADSH